MPRLLLFAPCQRALIDREDGTVSLISLITGITATPLPNVTASLVADAIIPFPWATVALWAREADDGERTFEQRLQIILPDGTQQGEALVVFTFTDPIHHNVTRGEAFPVGQSGTYQLRLALREVGTDIDWMPIAEYPILLRHAEQVAE